MYMYIIYIFSDMTCIYTCICLICIFFSFHENLIKMKITLLDVIERPFIFPLFVTTDPEVIKLFILNSTEHEIYPAHKC